MTDSFHEIVRYFTGVVEDRSDPLRLGRVRVRIFGAHTSDKTLIATEDLHWAYVMQPITSAAMNGIGSSPVGPVPGTHVVGFFRDGVNAQDPIIIGTIGGIPEEPAQNSKGFYDPRDNPQLTEKLANAPRKIATRVYPKDGSGAQLNNEPLAQTYPRAAELNEPDTNRLARNEKIDQTVVQVKKDNVDTAVPIAFGGTWSEPQTPYAAQYPFNHVDESESGHIREWDDTPNAERTHEWHRSGTFREVHPTGTEVTKIVYDRYTVLLRNDSIHVMGTKNETCDKDSNLYVKGRLNVQVDANVNLLVNGSVFVQAKGDANLSAGGNLNIGAGGNVSISAGGTVEIKNGGVGAWDAPELQFNGGVANPVSPTLPKQ